MVTLSRLVRILAIASLLTLVAAPAPFAQTIGQKERFTAWAVNMGNIGTGANSTVTIQIDRWSSEAEREKLITTFLERGQDKLLDALQDTKRVGFIRLPNSLGYDLRFARETPAEDGGRRVFVVTDRRIGFQEAASRPRSIDYPFTLIEIHLNKDGEGEGKMSVATKLSYNKKDNIVELENYSSEPVRLQNVKAEPIK